MIRTKTIPLALAIGLLCVPAAARAERSVKVSFSPEDPNVQTIEHDSTDELEVYVFSDGAPTRGGEFGLAIEGADFIRYDVDTFFAWLTMPIPNPYPGTISQATGPDCLPAPVYFGKMILKPHEAGGRIVVDVIPSMWSSSAALLDCQVNMLNGVRAYPATANPGGQPAKSHEVNGSEWEAAEEAAE